MRAGKSIKCAAAFMTGIRAAFRQLYPGSLLLITRSVPLRKCITRLYSSQRESGVASCIQACRDDWPSEQSSAKTLLGLGLDYISS